MSRILFIVHSATYSNELARLARMMQQKSSDNEIIFYYIAYGHWTSSALSDQRKEEGFVSYHEPDLLNEVEGTSPGQSVERSRRSLTRLLARVLSKLNFDATSDYLSNHKTLSEWIVKANRIYLQIHPDVVVLGGDNVGYTTSSFIYAAREIGLPTAIVSSTLSNGMEEATVYSTDPRYYVQGMFGRFLAAKYPKWVYDYYGQKLLRVPAGRVLAMEHLGLSPPEPWTFNSGAADAIAIESEAMAQYYEDAGLPRDQMILTGSPSDDELSEVQKKRTVLRNELCSSLDIPTESPIVLTALPSDFLYMPGGRPQCDFKEYEALVRFWMESLTSVEGWTNVISLHPSDDPDKMPFLQDYDIKIAPRNTASVVPLCDLFVASVSCTIRWAIACGIPVVNYDVYRFRYIDYLNVEGVVAVEEQEEFRSILGRLASEPETFEKLRHTQARFASQWGKLDGCSVDRISRMLDLLAKGHRIKDYSMALSDGYLAPDA